MFNRAAIFNQDISLWNTANVISFGSMFENASAFNQLIPRNGNYWNTINANQIGGMFGASNFNNSSITNWNISNVQYMSNLFFQNRYFNQDISSWDTSNVLQMNNCFNGGGYGYISNFNQNLANWNVRSVGQMENLFINNAMSSANYSSTLIGWASQSGLQSNVTLNADSTYNNSAVVARNILTSSPYNWAITDGGLYGSLITCFKSDTLILCLIDDVEKYILVQDIHPNSLVKTYKHGFKKVDIICKSVMQNLGTDERIKEHLYKCPMHNYPELIEDLYITGAHSILVDSITDEQYKKTEEMFGHLYLTDDKVRLMTYLDDRALPYNDCNKFEIWHFALENDDYYGNYGIYANGLLVETASKRWMLEYADMEIVT
jgi:hypothetical protein